MYKKYLSQLMAILMITILCVGFVSCGDDDDEPTTYTLKWDTFVTGVSDVTLFEYTESGDRINNHRIDNLTKGGTYSNTASDKAAKVKVYFELSGSVRWVQQVYYLKPGNNITIEVTDNTIVGRSEP